MTIRTNPPGALVYVDGYQIGTTPVSTDFIYYGTRHIRLVRDGYETMTISQPIKPPWYQYFPMDFVTENVLPNEIRDERTLVYNLQPQRIEPTQNVLERAENLRRVGGLQFQGGSVVAPIPETIPSPGLAPPPGALPPPSAPVVPGQGAGGTILPPLPGPQPASRSFNP